MIEKNKRDFTKTINKFVKNPDDSSEKQVFKCISFIFQDPLKKTEATKPQS